MNYILQLTADEWARIQRAAKFEGASVKEFARSWIMNGVAACKDDYIMHNGEAIGDKLEIDALAQETLRGV
jgi:hypothetical protein